MAETNRSQKTSLFGAVIFFMCAVIFSLGIWSSAAKTTLPQDGMPQVKNETESFQLQGIDRYKEGYILRMKNISQKSITAYSLSTKSGQRRDSDYNISGDVIEPGEIEEIRLYTLNIAPQELNIRILLVIFADHSSEGDFKVAGEMRDSRLGEKVQYQRIRNILQETLVKTELNPAAMLSRLKERIEALSEAADKQFSTSYPMGLRRAKRNMLYLLDNLEKMEKEGKFLPQNRRGTAPGFEQEMVGLSRQTEAWISRN